MNNIINLILIFLLTAICGYLLGITITNVVDQRLSDISINLPKINLPRQNIYVNLDMDSIVKNKSIKPENINVENQFESYRSDLGPNFQLKSQHDAIQPLKPANTANQLAQSLEPYSSDKSYKSYEGYENNDNENELQIEQTGAGQKFTQTISVNNIPKKINDSKIKVTYDYGPTYYKHPQDLTNKQLQKFKLKAKIDKMTLQDYVNWVILFDENIQDLPQIHHKNLNKIKNGIRLLFNDIPIN